MTIINTTPDRIIQLGYEGEDRVTVLRFRYGADWLENGEGVFHIRVRRHGEHTAYNAQLVADDAENNCLLMTVANTELSVKGSGEMQVVYSGENFVKKSPIYSYNVSRAVDEPVDPPAQDVYTQIIESLSELSESIGDIHSDIRQMDGDISDLSERIGYLSALTTEDKSSLVSAINEVNEHGGASVTVDDALSNTSTNPVQNKAVTSAVQGKADIQTVSALADAVNGLDSDVQSLQTTVQGKANTATVTALTNRVTAVETDKATHDEVDTVQDNLNLLGQVAQQYMEQTSTTLSGLQTSKADKSYVDTQLAGKASAQTVSDLADDVSDLQTGLAGKVGDVQVNGTSIVTDGAANVPVAGSNIVGVVKTEASQGLVVSNTGLLTISQASQNYIKSGTKSNNPITPIRQHESVFYGLAKVAGYDEKNSTLPVGTYSDEAKVAIQKMLGIYEAPWELVREDTFTNAEEADHIITTDANGGAFELSDVILMFETPKQSTEAKKQGYGQFWMYYGDGSSDYFAPACQSWTQNANTEARGTIAFVRQEDGIISFSCTNGNTSTNASSLNYRWRTGFDGSAQSVLYTGNPVYIKRINIRAVTGTGHYKLYGKRKWT